MVIGTPADVIVTEPDIQALPRSSDCVLIRGWSRLSILAGIQASLAARIIEAARCGRTLDELSFLVGAPRALVEAVVERLSRSHILRVEVDAADTTLTAPDGALAIVDDPKVHDIVSRTIGASTASLLLDGDGAFDVAQHMQGRRGVLLPRSILNASPAVVDFFASGGGRVACYWRESGKFVVAPDISGGYVCADCLDLRERAGEYPARPPWHRPPRSTEDESRDRDPMRVRWEAELLVHVLSTLSEKSPHIPRPTIYELARDRVELTSVLGLPVCYACTRAMTRHDELPPTADELTHALHSSRSRSASHSASHSSDGGVVGRLAHITADRRGWLSLDQLADICRGPSDIPNHDLPALRRDLATLYGRRGVFRKIRPDRPPLAGHLFRVVGAEVADLRRISASNGRPENYDAWGAAWTMAGAVQRCLGEAVERYCALVHGAARPVVWGAEADLPDAVPIERFATFAETELRTVREDFQAVSRTSPIGWVPARSLVTGAALLVPAQVSLLAYTATAFEDPVQPNTNKGLASGRDEDQCLIHGVCELIEADALMIHFLNRNPVPELDLADTSHEQIDRLRDHLYRHDATLRAWDFATDLPVPTVLASVERQDGDGPVITFGMATRLDPTDALEKAVLEALNATCWLTGDLVESVRAHAGVPPPAWVSVRGRAKSLGASQAYVEELDWLLDRAERQPFTEYRTTYPRPPRERAAQRQELVRTLTCRGLEPLAADLSTPDVRSTTGLQVWRSIVPGLQPFSIGPLQARMNERIYSVPVRMGYRTSCARESDLNPLPHPCP